MSFGGGGSQQYFIDYIIRVKNEGTAGAGAFSQINQGMKQTQMGAINVTHAMEKMSATNQKVIQAGQGISKAMKGMAFGFLGLTTAGAEFFGMMSMWKATQQGVKEAQNEANKALAEGGKNSKEYKDAMMDVAKANRWAQMTFRNLMLSAFDLVPFFVLSVNGIIKLRSAYKLLREAQLEQATMKQVMAAAGIKEAAASNLATASYGSLTKAQRILKAEQALGISTLNAKTTATNVATAANVSHNGSLITQIPNLTKQRAGMDAVATSATRLSKAMRVLKIAMMVAIPLVIIEIASQAFQNNWGGFADKVNALGKAFGDAVPFMRGFLDIVGKIGRSIASIFTGEFDIRSIWEDHKEGAEEAIEVDEEAIKKAEELAETLRGVSQAGLEAFKNIAQIEKKGERKDAMNLIGIRDKDFKDYDKFIQNINKIDTTLTGFHDSISAMRTLNILQKFGLDVPNKIWKDMAKGLSKNFKDLGKLWPGEDVFDEFAKILKDASKKKGPVVMTDIFKFMAANPDFMPMVQELRPDLYEKLKALMEGAGPSIKSGLQTAFTSATTGWNSIINPNSGEGVTTFDKNGKAINTPRNKVPIELPPLSQQLNITVNLLDASGKVIPGAQGTTTGSGGMAPPDWLVTFFKDKLFNLTTWQNAIKTAADPTFWAGVTTDVNKNINTSMSRLNPNGDTGPSPTNMTAAPEWSLKIVPWLESTIFNKNNWGSAISLVASPVFWAAITTQINSTVNGALSRLQAANEADEFNGDAPGSGGMGPSGWIQEKLAPFFDLNNWTTVITTLANPAFWASVTTSINETVSNALNRLKANEEDTSDKNTPGSGGMGPTQWIYDTLAPWFKIETWQTKIDEFVKGLQGWIPGAMQTANAEVVNSIKIEPEFDFRNDAPKAHGGMEFKNGKWQKQGKGKGPHDSSNFEPLQLTDYPAVIKSIAISDTDPNFAPETSVNDPMTGTTDGSQFPPIELMGKIVSIDTTSMVTALQKVNETFGNTMLELADMWQKTMVAMGAMADIAVEAIGGVFSNLAVTMESQFNATEVNWNNATTNILSDAESASEQIQESFQTLNEQLEEEFNAMEENWQNAMDNMVSDAKSAVSGINKALGNIKREVVTVHRIITVGSLAKGGPLSIGSGIISAAGGKMLTTNGPGLYQLGDNPGGKESVWAIPHDNPSPTVANINRMYGTQIRRGGGDASLNQNITVVIPGNDIVNDLRLNRRIRGTLGRRMDRFGS